MMRSLPTCSENAEKTFKAVQKHDKFAGGLARRDLFRTRYTVTRHLGAPMWKLTIEDDQASKTVVHLVRDDYTIGRAEENTVRLTERNISRRHAPRSWNSSPEPATRSCTVTWCSSATTACKY